ncbi:MAG TPA: MFS transporter [Actinomycetota bacterium]|jgi:predicted MFS family arabinose efflux permease
MVKDEGPGIEVPLPHADAPAAPPRLLTTRPFLWLVLADGTAGLGRWGFFLAVVGDATYRLQATPGQVALLLAAFSLPFIVASPVHGILADRWSAKWLLVITVGLSAAVAAIPLATDSLTALYGASALFGLLHSSLTPGRGALVPRLVPQDRLVQANGMISGALSLQLIIGPSLAAALVRLIGPDAPYVVTLAATALSVALFLVVPDRRGPATTRSSLFGDAAAGFLEAWRTDDLRRVFVLAVSVWLLIGLLISLEPSYIRESLGRSQAFLGTVWAVYGAGELAGSVALSRVRGAGREISLVALGLLVAAAGFLIYVSVPVPAAVIAGNVVFGFGFPFFTATSQALIQRVAREPGQVSAAFSMTGEMGPVVAAAILIAVGDRIAVRPLLLSAGVVFTVVALAALRTARRVRAAA